PRPAPSSTLLPYPTLFRSGDELALAVEDPGIGRGTLGDIAIGVDEPRIVGAALLGALLGHAGREQHDGLDIAIGPADIGRALDRDRKSTRLNSSHVKISYA